MKTYYKPCPRCGANLDPGERCECGAVLPRWPSSPEQIGSIYERNGREARRRAAARWETGLDRLAGLRAILDGEQTRSSAGGAGAEARP